MSDAQIEAHNRSSITVDFTLFVDWYWYLHVSTENVDIDYAIDYQCKRIVL